LAEKLREVLSNAARLADLRKKARQTAEEVFAIEKTAESLISKIKDQ